MEEIKEIKHNFTPKHLSLTEEESLKVLSKFNISKSQLPHIKRKDPAIIHLNLEPGTIVKIIRKSETAHRTNFYRLVIE